MFFFFGYPLIPDDGSSLSEACSTPIIGGVRAGNLSNEDVMDRDLHASLLGTRVSSSSLGVRLIYRFLY